MEVKNVLQCDVETGICELPEWTKDQFNGKENKKIKLLYFTDPICSSCWGIEPQLRKLKQEYGDYIDIEYRMGGLLKSWEEYQGRDVNGPESVAQHWHEASTYYQMPIDGEVWNEDPLHSSYPPAMAVKAAQLQGDQQADRFLRRIKEMVFLEKKNITKKVHLLQAALDAGLDGTQFQHDFESKAKQLFEDDLAMAKAWGVRGFPTIFFIDEEENRFKVYGSKPYQVYEQALLKLLPGSVEKNSASSYEIIFERFNSVTTKEFAVFYDLSLEKTETVLKSLEDEGKVKRMDTRAGSIWKVSDLH